MNNDSLVEAFEITWKRLAEMKERNIRIEKKLDALLLVARYYGLGDIIDEELE